MRRRYVTTSFFVIAAGALYELQGSKAPWFMCWIWRCINCLFVCLLNFLTFFLPYFLLFLCFLSYLFLIYLSTRSIIELFCFHAWGRRLGRTSSKWRILCRVRRKNLNQSINHCCIAWSLCCFFDLLFVNIFSSLKQIMLTSQDEYFSAVVSTFIWLNLALQLASLSYGAWQFFSTNISQNN